MTAIFKIFFNADAKQCGFHIIKNHINHINGYCWSNSLIALVVVWSLRLRVISIFFFNYSVGSLLDGRSDSQTLRKIAKQPQTSRQSISQIAHHIVCQIAYCFTKQTVDLKGAQPNRSNPIDWSYIVLPADRGQQPTSFLFAINQRFWLLEVHYQSEFYYRPELLV